MNLASSFVNGFVNAAFGQDKLLTDDGNKWLYKNKDHGITLCLLYLCVALLISVILLYDVTGIPRAVFYRALCNNFLGWDHFKTDRFFSLVQEC